MLGLEAFLFLGFIWHGGNDFSRWEPFLGQRSIGGTSLIEHSIIFYYHSPGLLGF